MPDFGKWQHPTPDRLTQFLFYGLASFLVAWWVPGPSVAAVPERGDRIEGSKPLGAKQALRAVGIDENHLQSLADGKPLGNDEQEFLMHALLRIPEFFRADIERWSQPGSEAFRLVADSSLRRGEFFHLEGQLQEVEKHRLWPAWAQRFQFDRYYQCRVLLDRVGPTVIYVRNVPAAWQKGDKVDARAMFVKAGSPTGNRPTLIFAAARLGWHPATTLGRLGMDVGLLDDLQDDRPLAEADHEAFFQMLAAVGRMPADGSLTAGHASEPVAPLFNQPRTQRGRLVTLDGIARSVIEVAVDDPGIVARFGLPHYYQIAMFTADSQENPVIVCVLQLPSGMQAGNAPDYREKMRVDGFFLKKWAYRPALTTSVSPARQTAPLLIGREPIRFAPSRPVRDELVQWIVGGVIVAALLWLVFTIIGQQLASRDLRSMISRKPLSGPRNVGFPNQVDLPVRPPRGSRR